MGGKRSAQAGTQRWPEASGIQSLMAAIRHEARGVAREPDGGMPGRSPSALRSLPVLTAAEPADVRLCIHIQT